ncbi:hypothetical protein VC83_01452 [Pseudogymnoascus destructans]|uniref:Uncharacterized protein n=1 Tax=Pseudogymnoascus destructans TaxID=655981 RepID=A0A177AI84_9PEZI|nr:uncharacterized protein VC83_01452 [Pseudogymnoascus destructans]OAF61785.1 hypothetical protein VC83_01452 [Pseudogymnoascus destructans]
MILLELPSPSRQDHHQNRPPLSAFRFPVLTLGPSLLLPGLWPTLLHLWRPLKGPRALKNADRLVDSEICLGLSFYTPDNPSHCLKGRTKCDNMSFILVSDTGDDDRPHGKVACLQRKRPNNGSRGKKLSI